MNAATRSRAAAAIAVATLALLATSCGERGEPTGPAADLFPVTVTTDDRPLVVTQPPQRIAVLTAGGQEILDSLGAAGRIAGAPVDAAGRPQISKLGALRPDLVVAPSAIDDRALSRIAARVSAPVYLMPDASLRDVERAITQLGLIVAEPQAARRAVQAIEQRRSQVARKLRGRPRVDAFVDLGYFTTAPDQSLIGDLLREARGRNVVGVSAGPEPIDIATLRRLDPDVIVTTSDSGTTLASLRKHPKARRLRAVREGRVEIVDSALLDPGPRVGDGLLELARALHPDAFR